MNVVITGATSFIGISIINNLIKRNHFVWAVVRPKSVNRQRIPLSENIQIVECDMQELEHLPDLIKIPVDAFCHLAWEGVRAPYRDDAVIQKQNYRAAMKAVEVCNRLSCKKFIGCGSQAEYGKMNGRIAEDYPCNPNTEYGKAKYKACCDIAAYARQHQIHFIWGRIFSIYGPGDYEKSLIMMCIDKMKKNENIPLTECKQDWDYLYIDEAAEIFTRFITMCCDDGVYNVASGKHEKLKEYVKKIKCVTQSESMLEFGSLPYPESGMVSFIPVVSKLKEALKWQPKIEFEEGIQNILRGQKNEEN